MITITTEEFLRLKAKVKRLEEEYHKACGSYESHLNQLKKEFNCSSLDEANHELQQIEEAIQRFSHECEIKLDEFKRNWSEQLESRK